MDRSLVPNYLFFRNKMDLFSSYIIESILRNIEVMFMVFLTVFSPEAGEKLVNDLWPRVYKFVYYKVQNREEAEELTQETFRRVYHKLESGDIEEGKEKAYIMSAANNLITEVWRRRARQPVISSVDELKEQGWEPVSPSANVEEAMLVRKALARLSPQYRKVLTMRIIEGRPVSEVARKMKRKEGAIRSLQFRAVKALKESLEEGGFFHDS